jgi:ParB family chromosome partitioning protein
MSKSKSAQPDLFGMDEENKVAPEQPAAQKYKPNVVYMMTLDKLQPDPAQPRGYFDEMSLEALAASVQSQGVQQPVLFRLDELGGHILVAGERRWRAARKAGLKKIPALYVEGDPLEISLIENTLREDLTAIELAEALGKYREKRNSSLKELVGIIGKAESTVSEILSLNRLPDDVKAVCRKRSDIPRDALVRIARAATQEEMSRLFNQIVNGVATGRQSGESTVIRPVKFSTISKDLTKYTDRIGSIDVKILKPAQRKKLKPLVKKAVDDLSAILDNLEHD